MINFTEIEAPPTDAPNPCNIDDHTWELHIEGAGVTIVCTDPCDEARRHAAGYAGTRCACEWVPDEIDLAFGEIPIAVKFDTGPPDWETGACDDPSIEITARVVDHDPIPLRRGRVVLIGRDNDRLAPFHVMSATIMSGPDGEQLTVHAVDVRPPAATPNGDSFREAERPKNLASSVDVARARREALLERNAEILDILRDERRLSLATRHNAANSEWARERALGELRAQEMIAARLRLEVL